MRGIGQGRIGLDSVCFLVWLLAFLVKNDICIWEYQSAFFPIAIAEHGLHAALMGIVFSIPSLFPLRNSEEKLKLVNIAFLLPCNYCICISLSLFFFSMLSLVCAILSRWAWVDKVTILVVELHYSVKEVCCSASECLGRRGI